MEQAARLAGHLQQVQQQTMPPMLPPQPPSLNHATHDMLFVFVRL